MNRLPSILMLLFCLMGFAMPCQAGEETDQGISREDVVEDLFKKIPRIQVPYLEGEITVDGRLDEVPWLIAERLEITKETYPAFLEAAPVRTEVLVFISGHTLYVGFRADDPEPERIYAPLRDRDGIELDDYVGIAIDPEGKRLRSYEFYVNASGVQADWVRNTVEDKRSRDWDADWESAAVQTETGYTVEMRIPLGLIDFPRDAPHRLAVLKRHYPRNVRHHLSAIALVIPSAEKIQQQSRQILLTPNITYNPELVRDIPDGEDWFYQENFDFGLDLQYRFNPAWGMNITLNPNYLEVEADLTSTSINDPFTTLIPEKRPFFQKGSDLFGTAFDLVYTRNIEDPVLGIQMGGTENRWLTGNFVTIDRELSMIVPGNLGSERSTVEQESTSGAFRVHYDADQRRSVGFLSTVRVGNNGYHNVVSGLDFFTKAGLHHTLREPLF